MSEQIPLKVTEYRWVREPKEVFDAVIAARRSAGLNLHAAAERIDSSVAWVISSQGGETSLPSSIPVLERLAGAFGCELRWRIYSLRKFELREQQKPGQPVVIQEYNETPVPLHKQIKSARENAELTLEQFGRLVGMGPSHLHRWERPKPNRDGGPSLESLLHCLKALGKGLAFALIDKSTGQSFAAGQLSADDAEDLVLSPVTAEMISRAQAARAASAVQDELAGDAA